MKNARIMIHSTLALSSLVEHKIIIHLFERFITKSEEQWLENENYLFSEFLQRVKAIESQLQEKYNEYRSDLHSKWYVSAESDEYIKLIMNRES